MHRLSQWFSNFLIPFTRDLLYVFDGPSRAYITYFKYCKQNYLYAVTLTKHFLLTKLLLFSIIASGSYFSHAEAKCMEFKLYKPLHVMI